ncbi:outer membrane protein assembly factor BamE [Komagataeibacter xylinus]|uniref:Outer membrane protein assembly factor BamE n=1 Tax=Komagataeibacter xylinus TaxID=28448 RepID=A0A857FNZ5_KOMXY|nr:outer membrane protein assembly factor BamE [Komagataeibacter xylinus]QHC35906.1 outer membrane protein assembly factor BamE [Komagataeibacter xylinus]
MRSPKDNQPRSRSLRVFSCAVIGAGIALSGCSIFKPSTMQRGSLVEADDYNKLKIGETSRSDVMDALGSPTGHATFDDNTWLYVSMKQVLAPISFPQVQKQEVVVLTFDQDGVLRNLRTLHKDDARYVTMMPGKTPTPGTKINIMQQILGNVGRYNPLSQMSSTYGGSTGPMNSMNGGPGHGGAGNTLP